MYTNNVSSCIYNCFETKISRRVGEQTFVYVLLAAVTLLPKSEFLYRLAVGEHLVGECPLPPVVVGVWCINTSSL